MIGRGTRIFPGKDDCLIIDLVGASRDHKLVQAPTLFGLDTEDVGEQTVLEALGEKEKKDLEDTLVRRFVDASRGESSRRVIHWVTASPQIYALSAGDRGMVLMLKRGDGWVVNVVPRDRAAEHERLQPLPVDLELAQGIGEDYIRRASAERLVAENAYWRRNPASQKVLAALAKFRVTPPPDATAGEAGDLLTAAIARSIARRIA
jgi:hypothetical protein